MGFSRFFSPTALAALVILITAATNAAMAQNQTKNPYQDQIRAAALKLSQTLDKPQLSALQQVRTGFGMVRAVRIVKESTEDAVGLCIEANPDLKEAMTGQFENWKAAVTPALAQAEARMDEALEGDIFTSPKDVRSYLDLTDRAALHIDAQIDKTVVTTPEACRNLMDSFEETREKLSELLASLDWPD